MHDDMQLTDEINNICCSDAEAGAAKREEKEKNIIDVAASVATKLDKKHRNVSSLTVKEIVYLLFAVYNVTMSASKLRKPNYTACLMADMEKDIRKYERFLLQTSQDVDNSNTSEIPV